MGLMQDVNGNTTNPIQATKKLQHAMDIRPWSTKKLHTKSCGHFSHYVNTKFIW
jgi:hypothetical protein